MVIRVVAAAALLACLASASRAADCPPPERPPLLDIVIEDGGVAYDFTRTRAQLTQVPRELGATAPNHGREPQGLTFNKLSVAAAAELRYRDTGHGSRCISADRIVVTVSFQQRIFVDMRYREGSCERAAVLDHEHEHVRINRAAVRAHEGALRRAVAEILAAHPWYLAPSSRPLQEAYLAPIQDRIKAVARAIRDDADRHHAALDSPASYAATRDRCRDW